MQKLSKFPETLLHSKEDHKRNWAIRTAYESLQTEAQPDVKRAKGNFGGEINIVLKN